MKFGPLPDDILVMLIDPDIVTSDFLIEMDSSARRIFNSQLAGVKKALERHTRLPVPDTSKRGGRRTKARTTSKQAVDKSVQKEIKKIAENTLKELEEILPGENESVPLAQAEQLSYMAETLARVILQWELTQGGKTVPITEKRDLECCRVESSECRHAGIWLRTRSRPLLERLFQFACFEAQAPDEKKTAKQ